MATFCQCQWEVPAYHEAGHAVVHASLFAQCMNTTVSVEEGENRGHYGAIPPGMVKDQDDVGKWTAVVGGGAAAEIVQFNCVSRGVTGDKCKLRKGILLLWGTRFDVSRAQSELDHDFPEAVRLLQSRRPLLDAVAKAILSGIQNAVEDGCDLSSRQCVLTGHALQELCSAHGLDAEVAATE